jgi:hypothetical protein
MYNTCKLVGTELGQGQLGLKKIAIGFERVQLRVGASAMLNVCKALPIFERTDQPFLLFSAFPGSLVRDERIRNFTKGGLNSFFIRNFRLVSISFGEPHVRLDGAPL